MPRQKQSSETAPGKSEAPHGEFTDDESLELVDRVANLAVWKGLARNKTDAVSIANEAFTKAREKFVPEKGDFRAYFTEIFLNAVRSHQPSPIRLPTGVRRDARWLQQWHDWLMELNDQKPSYEEIAAASGFSLPRVKRLLGEWQPLLTSESLDDSYDNGQPKLRAIDARPAPELRLQQRQLLDETLRVAASLPAREKDWVKGVVKGLTDEEMKLEYGWSAETVRQAKHQAKKKLYALLGPGFRERLLVALDPPSSNQE